jgi:hypothetical protein
MAPIALFARDGFVQVVDHAGDDHVGGELGRIVAGFAQLLAERQQP